MLPGRSLRNENYIDSNFEQIVQLLGRHYPSMRTWLTESERSNRPFKITYMSHRIQEECLGLIGKSVKESILKK